MCRDHAVAGVSGREWHGMGWGWVKWGGVRGAGLLTSVDDANIPTWCRHDERNQNISKSGSVTSAARANISTRSGSGKWTA